ncbi:transmembrane protein 42-like [Ostrea edulis]|uniref:transmembrane protein 42-like n=1 Tax=Ostrea edulis TaxID=37623 RepID=UPI0024AFE996|nr:transmembrane protein 42-like [Ostrea edulis]XP_048756162.2 transmembrane protein 42-like [Ostrea edulis]XP_048756169.2 transmembrane protein 42-like [Ostrea edulis]XP_056009214.1 transmembrane protein 42-like [Ostrea edulis]
MEMITRMHHGQGLMLAVSAGIMAAFGSVSAKLATSNHILLDLCQVIFASALCEQMSILLRILFFAMIFVCNGLMWTFFTKSLQFCSSTAEATVTNTASNFLVSALMGVALFNETLTLRWWMGASLIVLGLLLIHRANMKEREKDKVD